MRFNSLVTLLLVLLLLGCSTGSNYAPIEDRSKTPFSFNKHHIVSHGETLYSIAWRYNLDARGLAATNKIKSPYVIHPGNKLLLNDKGKVTFSHKKRSSSVTKTARSSSTKRSVKAPASSASNPPKSSQVVVTKDFPFRWYWPAKGKLSKSFKATAPQHKGIDLHGKLREPVFAANSGKVVYAGSGLTGYGKLLILKHGDRYLSAYAHNSTLLVGEGQMIKVGQKIAEMGDTGTSTNTVKLHFEIRRDGKPVDPTRLLPKR